MDRGTNSIEVIVYLMALKVLYPKNVYMLRGNHESRAMTELYNFKTECMEKYSQDIYTEIMDVLDWLPLACIVNRRFFCVHGGISDKFSEVMPISHRYHK